MRGLLAGIANRLSGRQANREAVIAKAMAFKMRHVVDEYRRKSEVSEFQALELERELKRYLAMCALHPRMTFPMGGPVDDLWHVFLTHTADYRRFCDGIAGRMIHHWPAGSAGGGRTRRANHDAFIRIYHRLYGVLPAAHVWPFMEGLFEDQSRPRGHQAKESDGYGAGVGRQDGDGALGSELGAPGGSDGGGCAGGGD
ncbi:MAG TPA: hypothetical protein VH835_10180 [Dongiaceae bacterium]|jgi:hypothetical protein